MAPDRGLTRCLLSVFSLFSSQCQLVKRMTDSMPLQPVLGRKIRTKWKYLLPWVVVLTQSTIIILLLVRNNVSTCSLMASCRKNCHNSPGAIKSYKNMQELVRESQTDSQTFNYELELPIEVATDPSRLVYNRVPKCGSSTLMDLIIEMSKINNFTFIRAREYMRFYLEDRWQRVLVSRIKRIPTPMVYERHLHFLDFSQFGVDEQPVYVNLIRNPLERLVSWYYFRRYQKGHIRDMPTSKRVRTYDECVLGNHSECTEPMGDEAEEGYFKIIPFFCGQEDFCREPGERALIKAIRNVKHHYAVIGVMENYPKFITALEHVMPKYFKGASTVYQVLEEEWKSRHKTTYKLPTSPEVNKIMLEKLEHEYKFYNFIRQRFYRLMNTIENAKRRKI